MNLKEIYGGTLLRFPIYKFRNWIKYKKAVKERTKNGYAQCDVDVMGYYISTLIEKMAKDGRYYGVPWAYTEEEYKKELALLADYWEEVNKFLDLSTYEIMNPRTPEEIEEFYKEYDIVLDRAFKQFRKLFKHL